MRIKIDQFLRNFGIRTSGELLRPRLFNVSKLILPHETTYHFIDSNTAVSGPNQNDPLFNKYRGKVFLEHVTKLEIIEGNPVRTSAIAASLSTEFRRNNRFFKPLRKDEAVKLNTQNIAVFNYSLLNRLYRYHANIKANWFRWANINHTFWKNVLDVGGRFGWNQFVELELPRKMPTYAEFRRLEKGTTKDLLELFDNDAVLMLADFIKFFGENQSESNLYQLLKPEMLKVDGSKETVLHITREVIDKVDILIRVKNSFFVINLGKLYDFRENGEVIEQTPAMETYIDSLGLESSFKPNMLQLRLVSLFTTLSEYNNGNDEHLVETEIDQIVDQDDSEPEVDEPSELLEADTAEEPEIPELDAIDTDVSDLEDERRLIETKVETRLSKTFDLDSMEITYTPPPDTELELTTLVIEKDPLANMDLSDNKLNVDTTNVNGTTATPLIDDPYASEVAKSALLLANAGVISPRSYEQALEQAVGYKSLPSPFDPSQTIEEAMTVTKEDLELPDNTLAAATVNSEPSMLKAIHRQMNVKYVDTLMEKDILRTIISVQTQGVSVTKIEQETVEDALNHFRVFKVTLKPVRGKQSTVRFNIPVIDEDGRFKANGVTYSQRSQVGDIPIRKINPTRVALTSYYSKLFVNRSSRVTNDYDRWLKKHIIRLATTTEAPTVTHLKHAEKDMSEFHLPRIYSALAESYNGFTADGIDFYFDYTEREEYFLTKGIVVSQLEENGMVVTGHKGKVPVLVDPNGHFYLHSDKDGISPIGRITDILDISLLKAPLESVTLSVMNKDIPLGLILAYRKGLTNLLNDLKIDYQTHQRGTRLQLKEDEYTLVFMDEVLVFNRDNYEHVLILSGLKRYQKTLQQFSRWDFDRQDVYFRILDDAGITTNYIREIDTLFASWIDPITRDLLVDAGEPTDFEGLLYRSVELLLTDWSPSEVDGAYMRYKGYERMAGTIYNTLIKTVKVFNARQGRGEQMINLPPFEIWKKIVSDPTVSVVEDSNPIQNLREQEVVTFSGEGGRSGQTMVARTRLFHKNDLGIVSEATVDSGNTGAIFYLTPDANFKNMRGMTRPYNPETDGPAKVFSTTALISASSDTDDTKRQIFTGVQHAQTIHANGYEVTALRTGYENIVAQRTSSIFAQAAKANGTVTKVGKAAITVTYEDGKTESYQLGSAHGSAAGVTYPYVLSTQLKVGDTFKFGDTLSYNNSFFKPDRYTPNQVNWKAGTVGRIAFMDNADTLEDGSVISARIAETQATKTSEIRTVVFRFDQVVSKLVKVGDDVDLDSILCIIQDPEVAGISDDEDDVSLLTLKKMSSNAPRAKAVGKVSKIECYYHGDIEDVGDDLQEMITKFDNERMAVDKAMGRTEMTGQDDGSLRIRGAMLEPFSVALRIYIDQDIKCGTGDKLVLFNQMKTVISKVMTGENYCEDNVPLDVQFGKTSIDARQVLSPIINSTTTLLLRKLSEHVVKLYKGETNARAK